MKWLIALILLCGCAEKIDYVCWEKKVSQPEKWLAESRKRFKDPFIFMCHGDDDGFQWWVSPDDDKAIANTYAIAKLLHEVMPDRDIVLVVCNTMHRHIGIFRVWHADDKTWSSPDKPGEDYNYGTIWEYQND